MKTLMKELLATEHANIWQYFFFLNCCQRFVYARYAVALKLCTYKYFFPFFSTNQIQAN